MSAVKPKYHGAVLIAAALFACALALCLPLPALAAEGDSPDHVLTYTTGSLTWDDQTEVRPDGTARMGLFSETHQNVASSNGERVLAPGTASASTTRLENESTGSIRYIAVMYRIKDEPALPVEPELSGSGFEETDDYPLPGGIEEGQVVRAVTGTVEAGGVQDFGIAWSWSYFEDGNRDVVDTRLGDTAAYLDADEVTAGLYIVVEDDSSGTTESYIYPSLPNTGDDAAVTVGALLATAVLSFAIASVANRWKVRKCEGL